MKKIVTKLFVITVVVFTVFNLSACSINLRFFKQSEPTKVNISGNSMYPTLIDGEAYKIVKVKDIQRSDIVVIGNANNFLSSNSIDSEYIIKRVIAIPGDTVKSVEGVIYVNSETYIASNDNFRKILKDSYEIALGEGEYFVIGDNFENSNDSRVWNKKVVPEENILYKVIYE